MVKFFLNLLAFAPLFATLAITQNSNYIQINYFNDNNCTDFASSPPVVPLDFGVYNWETPGTNSAGIANCDGYQTCWCWFYPSANASGTATLAQYPSGNFTTCVTGQFASFDCQIAA